MKRQILPLLALAALIAVAPAMASAAGYVVLANKHFDRYFAVDIEAAGGQIVAQLDQIGVAIVESNDANFVSNMHQSAMGGIRSIVADVAFETADPVNVLLGDAASPPFTGDDDFLFDLQWGHTAIEATNAWEAGHRGAGVRVAVLDSGILSTHPDLAPNLNAALSTSFVAGEDFDNPPGFHGSHVAGTIGAADNAFGTIGVAPEVELVSVKVLSAINGSGSFGGIIQGIVYAANIDADVINMSLGINASRTNVLGGLPRNCKFVDVNGDVTKDSGCAELFVATGRATTYAYQQGTTVIVSAGNDRRDLDRDSSVKTFPGELPHVIAISATAPIGWAKDPAHTFLDNLASYSNYGQSGIHFAAPGGDFVYPRNETCTISSVTVPCWIFDLVLSTNHIGGWSWSAGTSMAAPHAAGVAALIIGANGGDMHPGQVEAELRKGADDLGKKGKDDAYGAGRVNAANSVD